MCVWYYGAFDKAPYIYYTIEVLLLLLLCVRTLCSIYFFTVYNMDEFAQQIRLLAEWQDRNFNDEEEGKKISNAAAQKPQHTWLVLGGRETCRFSMEK